MKEKVKNRRAPVRVLVATATAVVLAGLAACSGAPAPSGSTDPASTGPKETPEIVLQTWGDTKYAEQQAAIYNQTFPDEPVNVKVTAAGQIDSESIEQFRLALSSGQNIPDILQLNYSSVPEFAQAGVLADVGAYVQPYLDGVTEAGRTLMQYDGVFVAFPYEVKTKLWFYRTDLFADAGIDVASVKTQEDFVAAGKQLQAAHPESYIWNIGPNTEYYNLAMIVSGNGAQFSTQEPCAVLVGSDPGTSQAFRALYDLSREAAVNTKIDDWTPEWQQALADGTIASTLLASWFPTFLKEYAPDLSGKWAVTTWPVIGGAEGGSESAGSLFVIPEASKNKEAAAKFLIGTLLDATGSQAYVEARGGGYLPAVTEVLNSDYMKNNEYFGTSLAEAFLESGKEFKIFPYGPNAMKEQAVLRDQLIMYLAGDDPDPSAVLQVAQDELTAQVGCPA